MGFNQIKRLYHTLRYLRLTQVYYQIKYRLFKPKRLATPWYGSFIRIELVDYPFKRNCFAISGNEWSFDFLNLEYSFSQESLEWSFPDYGMLWRYNLNYFDWLHQPDMSMERGLLTLSKFYSTSAIKNPIILHPYPTSLRIINVSKFISKWNIKEKWLYTELVSDLKFLSRRLEYHLLANHLLENAFALFIGGLITDQKEIIRKGKQLVVHELNEQVLKDGMHYERSPMYHLIILERLLDAFNFAKSTKDDLESVLKTYSIKMTGLAMNWYNLDRIPMMQDSAYGIASTVPVIIEYSKRLLGNEFPIITNQLKDSGYRKLNSSGFSLFANVGSIGPSYQPGHAHADELNFELYHNAAPVIVDTGISTYENCTQRLQERSTKSHNCVALEENSSEVWSGFRVGTRARVTIKFEDEQVVKAQHDGYKFMVSRMYDSSKWGQITIEDEIIYSSPSSSKFNYHRGYLHLHPSLELEQLDDQTIILNQIMKLKFQTDNFNNPSLKIEDYQYANGYNKLIPSRVISYSIFKWTRINIIEIN